MSGSKMCSKCGDVKLMSEFHKDATRKNGRYPFCKSCESARKCNPVDRARSNAYYHSHRAQVRSSQSAKRLGVSTAEYRTKFYEFLVLQDSECGMCGDAYLSRPKHFVMDHDHGSGRLRGVLCTQCNTALGSLKEDPDRFRGGLEYMSVAC